MPRICRFHFFRVAQNLRYLLVVRTAKHERYVAEASISHRCQTFFLYFQHRCSFELACGHIVFGNR